MWAAEARALQLSQYRSTHQTIFSKQADELGKVQAWKLPSVSFFGGEREATQRMFIAFVADKPVPFVAGFSERVIPDVILINILHLKVNIRANFLHLYLT